MNALQAAIQALHAAIAEQADRGDKVLLAQALQIVLKVQANDVQQGEGRGPAQQGPPQGGQGGPPPALLQALAARLQGGQ